LQFEDSMSLVELISNKVFLASLFGAGAAIAVYKLFRENETDLTRRLDRQKRGKKPVRIWIDGCFDLMHFGHANAFRQAKALGDVLVVGLNMDKEIVKYKGPPIMTEEERYVAVSACKWVDEVVRDVPYVMNQEYLEMIFDKHKIDYVVHGDDPCLLPDGTDVFATAKAAGRFKTIKRTEGVSTTDIVGRMLLMTKDHFRNPTSDAMAAGTEDWETGSTGSVTDLHHNFVRQSDFLPTARRINQFSSGKTPKSGDVIVYIDGAWDMFHAGHIDILKSAQELGDFLIVGVHSDQVVNDHRGSNYPILNLHERVLSVLSCKYVDEVVFGAPWKLTKDLIVSMNIQVIAYGEVGDSERTDNPYEVGQSLPNVKVIPLKSNRKLTTANIVERILQQKLDFEAKFNKKNKKEKEYMEQKSFVQEV